MHLVHRHNIEVSCTSKSFGLEVQYHCGDVIRSELYPSIEQLLSAYDVGNSIWKIDSIDVSIDCNADNWKHMLVQETLTQIEYFLRNKYKHIEPNNINTKSDIIDISDYCFNLFLAFIQTAIIRANIFSVDIYEIIKQIRWEEISKVALLKKLSEHPRHLIRFLLSISNKVNNNLKAQWLTSLSVEVDYALAYSSSRNLRNDNLDIRNLIKESFLWTTLIGDEIGDLLSIKGLILELQKLYSYDLILSSLIELQENLFFENKSIKYSVDLIIDELTAKDKYKSSQALETNTFDGSFSTQLWSTLGLSKNSEEFFIEHAGLIILHPFLESLFNNLGLLSENSKWVNAISQHKAILIMHYLCAGNELFWGNSLVFYKLYCGMSSDTVLNIMLRLSDEEKDMCNEMLSAVIKHWSKLGSTSIEGLQQTFLQRKGKVVIGDKDLTLFVENSGVDILLEFMPWGISMIKSPWLDKIIYCNWEY